MAANVPPALRSGGILLLMLTNIPKSGMKKLLFKEEILVLNIPKNPKPRHSIKPLLGDVFVNHLEFTIQESNNNIFTVRFCKP